MKILLVFLTYLSYYLVQSERNFYSEDKLPGIVLIPGDGGNQLEAQLAKNKSTHFYCYNHESWFSIWLNIIELAPEIINCWLDNMVLEYDNTTHTTRNPEGVDIRVPGWGDVCTIDFLTSTSTLTYPYFAYITAVLRSLGYVSNVNLKGAPYDFRKAPNELGPYFIALTSLIEDLRASTGGPVLLVLHSYGAPLTNFFLNTKTEAWRKENVLGLVALSGAWGGSAKAVKVYAAGDNLNNWLLDRLSLRAQQRTCPSLSFLLPDEEVWGERTLAEVNGTSYGMHNIDDFFRLLDLPDAVSIHHDTAPLLAKSSTPPRVELHCLYGTQVDTMESISYPTPSSFPDNPSIQFGDGDGTVNLRSSQVCQGYEKMQSQKVYSLPVPSTDHMQILSSTFSLNYIAGVVTREAQRRTFVRAPPVPSAWLGRLLNLLTPLLRNLAVPSDTSSGTSELRSYAEGDVDVQGLVTLIDAQNKWNMATDPAMSAFIRQRKAKAKLEALFERHERRAQRRLKRLEKLRAKRLNETRTEK